MLWWRSGSVVVPILRPRVGPVRRRPPTVYEGRVRGSRQEMSQETIDVAEVSAGKGGTAGEPGDPVELPVVEVLTGRAFITGKSGSGKSNTMSVVAEKLLDGGYPVMLVDTDGEY